MSKQYKILLLQAPCKRLKFNISDIYPLPRLGLANISSYLKYHTQNEVIIYDFKTDNNWLYSVTDYILNYTPDIIGISATILSLKEAFIITKAAKEISQRIITIIGGYGTGFPKESLFQYSDHTDFFIRGDGEISFLKLLRALESNDFISVPGLLWKEKNNINENKNYEFRDLNDGILPDYNSLPMKKYHLHPPMGVFSPSTIVETSRGCSYNCSFCCLSRPVSFKSPENVLKELRFLISNYSIKEFHFIDPTFTLDFDRTYKITKLIKPLNIKWSCKTRVDKVPAELLKAMADSGCYLISFGVESASDKILDATNKEIRKKQTIQAFNDCKNIGIRTAAYLIVGNPGESDSTINNTINFVDEISPNYVLYGILMPDPFNLLTISQISSGKFTYKDLCDYYLTDNETKLHKISMTGQSMDILNSWLKKCTRTFYFNPRYILKTFFNIRYRGDIKNLIKGVYFLMKEIISG